MIEKLEFTWEEIRKCWVKSCGVYLHEPDEDEFKRLLGFKDEISKDRIEFLEKREKELQNEIASIKLDSISDSCHLLEKIKALENKPKKYKCTECNGDTITPIDLIKHPSWDKYTCKTCNNKGYIELKPWSENDE